ncbi:MAG TPA: addiction module protein [bacterium]
MNAELNFEQMSISEKLRIMEFLWDDLCRTESDIPSPQWHESVLMERENLINNGRDEFIDWDDAKKEMRKKIS